MYQKYFKENNSNKEKDVLCTKCYLNNVAAQRLLLILPESHFSRLTAQRHILAMVAAKSKI